MRGGGDEIASVGGKIGDIADSAGTGSLQSAEGLANQIGNVGFTVFAGGGGSLNEHGLQHISN